MTRRTIIITIALLHTTAANAETPATVYFPQPTATRA